MSRSARNHLIGFSVVFVLVATLFLLPLGAYRVPMEQAASKALSREVHINGPIRLTFYPNIGVALTNVTIANPKGSRDPQMMTVESLIVGAKLLPLFTGRLEVTELTLQKPQIHLEVAKDGIGNWTFGQQPGSAKPADASALDGIGFSHVNIRDGAISYFDASTGKNALISEVSLSLDMPDTGRATLALPLTIRGSLTYNDQNLKVDGRFDNFGAMLAARPTGMRASIQSNIVNADFTGQIGKDGGLSGAIKLGAHSVRSLAAWLGSPMPAGNGFGLAALEGQFTGHDGVYTLAHTHLAFDSMNINGEINFDTNPKVLTVRGHVTVNRLDLNPYLAPGAEDDTVIAAKAKAANPGAPLSLGGLKAINADVTLVLGGLVLPAFKLDQAIVKANLEGGVLKAEMTSLAAYGGAGSGSFTVDASGATPTFSSKIEMRDIGVQPYLSEMMGVNRLSGKGALRYEVASRGNTTDEIVKNLGGKGDLRVTDGSLTGVDLVAVSQVLQSVLNGDALLAVTGASSKTDFTRMGATFTIDNGVMRTKDIQLINPAAELNGRGDIDLSARTMEFHLDPKATKGLPGVKLVDIGVPFYVKGPWAKLSYGPDVGGLAKNVVRKLSEGASSPLDILTRPGLSLKSLLGTDKPSPR